MKTLAATALLSLAACLPARAADSYAALTEALEQMPCYAATAQYTVLLPMMSEPVIYSVALESEAAPADTLSACSYYLEWSLPTPSGMSSGFASYADGTHFRFRDTRLQEYHAAENAQSFAPGGDIDKGVQNQAQFAELMPQNIGRRLRQMAVDSSYISQFTSDIAIGGRRCTVVKGVKRAGGYDSVEYTYIFDYLTSQPIKIELENNPGQISEQSVTVEYTSGQPTNCDFSIEGVSARQAEAFERYRENTFSVGSLAGKPLPRIVAPTLAGDRYIHERGEAFGAPTVVVFLESAVDSTPALIAAVRDAVDLLPGQVDVLWAFLDHRAEEVTPVMPEGRPGEHVLVNARGAARACGVGALTPILLFVDRAGNVSDFYTGFNQDLRSIVIEKMSIAASAR